MKYDDEIRARSYRFRDEYVAATPAWYRGELHLAFTLLFTGGVIAWCAMKLQAPTLAQWLAIVPIFLLGNWAEWAAHRYILHRPTRLFSAIYKRHCAVHHRFFTHLTLSTKARSTGAPCCFHPLRGSLRAGAVRRAVIGVAFSKNAGYIALMTMAAYYLMYEGLHTLSHITDSPLLDRMPFVGTVRRLHVTHHDPELMATQNFNLTFPICDTLFGTRSDVPREVRSPMQGQG
uniref:Putative hydroxylase n=1 Tax=Cupriavidus basilensis TaxID=68895 RepID=D5KB62_9BURK|nr:putative hydroxylase [Cupriavidus basilensis]